VVEAPLAALAAQHRMLAPMRGEGRAAPAQFAGQRQHGRIVEMAGIVGAEFRDHAPRALRPVVDQLARRRRGEQEAQQIPVVPAIEPAGEQFRRWRIPQHRVAEPVEHIGGRADRGDRGVERGGQGGRGVGRRRARVAPAGKLEQIGALGGREKEGVGEARQRRRRRRDRPSLLDPCIPGGADPGDLRQFLAAQTGGSASPARRQAETRWRQALAAPPQKISQLVPIRHGINYTRIKINLVPG